MTKKRLVNIKEKNSNEVLRVSQEIAELLQSERLAHPNYPDGKWAFISKGALKSKINQNIKKAKTVMYINKHLASQNYQDENQTLVRFAVSSGKVDGWRKTFGLLKQPE